MIHIDATYSPTFTVCLGTVLSNHNHVHQILDNIQVTQIPIFEIAEEKDIIDDDII